MIKWAVRWRDDEISWVHSSQRLRNSIRDISLRHNGNAVRRVARIFKLENECSRLLSAGICSDSFHGAGDCHGEAAWGVRVAILGRGGR